MKFALATALLAQSLIFATPGVAAIVCEGKTGFDGALTLTLNPDDTGHLLVKGPDGAVELEQDFPKLDNVWDGHMTGLITGPGLAVKYENQYGCIRHVVITANIRGGGIGFIQAIQIPVCKGGSTPDSICIR